MHDENASSIYWSMGRSHFLYWEEMPTLEALVSSTLKVKKNVQRELESVEGQIENCEQLVSTIEYKLL